MTEILRRTGIPDTDVLNLPTVRKTKVDVRFSFFNEKDERRIPLDPLDLRLLAELENGLPLVNEPYEEIGKQLNLTGTRSWKESGTFRQQELSGNSGHVLTRGG